MPLLRLNRVSLAFGHRPLLDKVELELFRGERVCLLGRNGEGKSSLLRVIGGEAMTTMSASRRLQRSTMACR